MVEAPAFRRGFTRVNLDSSPFRGGTRKPGLPPRFFRAVPEGTLLFGDLVTPRLKAGTSTNA